MRCHTEGASDKGGCDGSDGCIGRGGVRLFLRFAHDTRLCPSHPSQPSHIGLRDQPQLIRATWSPLIAEGLFELGAPVASALSIRKA